MKREGFIKELEYADDVLKPAGFSIHAQTGAWIMTRDEFELKMKYLEEFSRGWSEDTYGKYLELKAHDAEQRKRIEQQAAEIARLREAPKVLIMERNSAYWKIRSRIEKMVDARNEIVTGDDGYAVFWPTKGRGYHSAYELRILADILDDRNKAWDETVKRELMVEP